MNSERIKEIQNTTPYPDSVSVQQALLQVWNECGQEQLQRVGNSPFMWDDNKVLDFVNWYIKLQDLNFKYTLENRSLLDKFKNGDE